DSIEATIHPGNRVTVCDNGRGIPVDIHPTVGIPALEVIMTTLHSGGKFGGSGYTISGGLHGVGLSVVNALSSEMEVKVRRDNLIYRQCYEKGNPVSSLEVCGETDETGTSISFLPDAEIFEETVFDREIIIQRLRELSFLNRGLRIKVSDLREEEPYQKEFFYSDGLRDFITYVNKNKEIINEKPLYFETQKDDVIVQVAVQYNTGYSENLYSFTNNIRTQEGGTHEVGFKNGLTRVINDYARKHNLIKDNDGNLSGED
ncbi:MAG TPA: DNA topoisomerase IV subunit B, partial [Syntrophomonas sp.]|nr:DNA topoisomerase IV subunit B [Syntrophomonas sp.]